MDSDNLLSFIIDHNDAYKSRGRLISLYSDFPLHKSINPDGYSANLAAWQTALASAAFAGLLPAHRAPERSTKSLLGLSSSSAESLSTADPAGNPFLVHAGDELTKALEQPGLGRPEALGDVFADAVKRGDYVPLSRFLTAKSSVAAKSWLPSFSPWALLSWGFSQLGQSEDGLLPLERDSYVVRRNLDIFTQKLVAQIRKSDKLTYTTQLLADILMEVLPEGAELTPLTVQLLLLHLSRDCHPPVATFSQQSKVIKFAASHAFPEPITDSDIRMARLSTIITSLSASAVDLEKRIDGLLDETKASLAKKDVAAAKSLLKRKKVVEASLAERRAAILELESVLLKIEDAHNRVSIFKELESSTGVLKELNLATGGADAVDRIIDALHEEQQTGTEIAAVFSHASQDDVSDDVVLAELAEMETEEREKIQMEADLQKKLEERAEALRLLELERRLAATKVPDKPVDPDDLLQGIDRLMLQE